MDIEVRIHVTAIMKPVFHAERQMYKSRWKTGAAAKAQRMGQLDTAVTAICDINAGKCLPSQLCASH